MNRRDTNPYANWPVRARFAYGLLLVISLMLIYRFVGFGFTSGSSEHRAADANDRSDGENTVTNGVNQEQKVPSPKVAKNSKLSKTTGEIESKPELAAKQDLPPRQKS